MEKMYGIVADYNVWKPAADGKGEGEAGTETMYLGIAYPPHNAYVFDKTHNSRSFRWSDKKKAEKYIKDHNLYDSICYENIRVVEVEIVENGG